AVKVILQVEHARETRAGGKIFVPAAIAALSFHQVVDAFVQALAGSVTTCNQPQNGPCGLRRSATGGRERPVIVAATVLAPAPVSVLNGPKPLAGGEDMRLAVAFSGCLKTA